MNLQKRPTVLIIDDNELTRTLLRMAIPSDQFEVIGEASNAASGMERVMKMRPDLICLDVLMPDSDGLDFLCELRTRVPASLVMMVSASCDIMTVRQAIALGAAGFIVKPFNAGAVIDAMNKVALKLSVPGRSSP